MNKLLFNVIYSLTLSCSIHLGIDTLEAQKTSNPFQFIGSIFDIMGNTASNFCFATIEILRLQGLLTFLTLTKRFTIYIIFCQNQRLSFFYYNYKEIFGYWRGSFSFDIISRDVKCLIIQPKT